MDLYKCFQTTCCSGIPQTGLLVPIKNNQNPTLPPEVTCTTTNHAYRHCPLIVHRAGTTFKKKQAVHHFPKKKRLGVHFANFSWYSSIHWTMISPWIVSNPSWHSYLLTAFCDLKSPSGSHWLAAFCCTTRDPWWQDDNKILCIQTFL